MERSWKLAATAVTRDKELRAEFVVGLDKTESKNLT